METNYNNDWNKPKETKVYAITLNDAKVTERQDKTGADYYIVFDNETRNAYFGFKSKLGNENFERMKKEYADINRIQITVEEDEKGKKVTDFKLPKNE